MQTYLPVLKEHFEKYFLKACAFFAIWFFVRKIILFLLTLPYILTRAEEVNYFFSLSGTIVSAAFVYAFWICVVLIFEGGLNKENFIKLAIRHYWFLILLFIFRIPDVVYRFLLLPLFYKNTLDYKTFFPVLSSVNLTLEIIKVVMTGVFLVLAPRGERFLEGIKNVFILNRAAVARFFLLSLAVNFLTFGVSFLLMKFTRGYVLTYSAMLLAFISQFLSYTLVPFLLLPAVNLEK